MRASKGLPRYVLIVLAISLHANLVVADEACSWGEDSAKESVCVVVRTYWGHGRDTKTGLRELLQSLRRQSISNWEAVIIVMDAKPFLDLARIVGDLNDERVWVYAEWIGVQFAPRGPNGYWAPSYHRLLYDLTDEAIQACSPQTRWLLVTNGDNEYASTALEQVVQSRGADVVAFDFYSRYQRVTGPRCERFSQQDGLPPCKVNAMRWCHTDLGANALNWPRLMREKRRFGTLPGWELGSDNFDGLMAQTLVEAGWNVHHKSNTCVFEHDPSPQRCAAAGGVWDDTLRLSLSSPGGDCISAAQADRVLAEGGVEDVLIDLSHDGRLPDFLEPGREPVTQIRCLRDSDHSTAVEHANHFFGTVCAAEFDVKED